jgi:2-dehydro-3-deoxy-D-gluconate 5-dehydrogenase
MESNMNLFSLAGKTALVTGGAVGIGQGIAVALAQAGANVAITTLAHEASETEQAVLAAGSQFASYQCDLASQSLADLNGLLEQIQNDLGAVDILVNNAGIIRRADADVYSQEDWAAVLELNLGSVWRLSQAAGKKMLARGHGRIISVASLLSFQGGVRVPAYTASKHAVVGLTKALANEWGLRGVTVNAIAPGYIETNNTTALREDPVRAKSILERIPAGRWGQAADLGGAAVFLASGAADYVNGHVLVVDGGWLAR